LSQPQPQPVAISNYIFCIFLKLLYIQRNHSLRFLHVFAVADFTEASSSKLAKRNVTIDTALFAIGFMHFSWSKRTYAAFIGTRYSQARFH
jgi:uncharacterized membrane protein